MDDNTTPAVYGKLFPEQVADKCSSDALEANNGPFAYLQALYQHALDLEKSGDTTQITLGQRRPDIGERVLDEGSLEDQIPSLTLVVEAMTRQAKLHVGDKKNLAEEIANSRYPVQLPFHHPLEQIKAVLGAKKCSLFSLLQQTDHSFPNFAYGNLRTDELRNIMRKAAGFSPTLQALLLDETPCTDSNFLGQRYGVTGTAENAREQLSDVEFLARQTGLKPEDVLDLLATSGVADNGQEAFTTVKQSKACSPRGETNAVLAGHLFGAVFINNARAPALSLQDTLSGAGITLRIKGANADHFGRIHKIIHLQHALQVPYADVDLLVMAALRAEGQTRDFKITENTLRALGVFLHLRHEYRITAEQFAALIDEVTPYAAGEDESFLDRVLKGPGASGLANISVPLVLDARTFDVPQSVTIENEARNPVIAELCRVFTLQENVAHLYLSQITQTLGLEKPTLTLGVFSSLYRLSRLPRLMRLSMNDGTSLIAILNAVTPSVMAQLAGKPAIADDENLPDILDVLTALANLEGWLRKVRLNPTVLLGWLTPYPAQMRPELKSYFAVDTRIHRTVLDALPRIKSSLVTESALSQAAGAGVALSAGSWLEMLAAFVDNRGLIKPLVSNTSEALARTLTIALKGKITSSAGLFIPEDEQANVAANIVSLLQNAEIAQDDAVKHTISSAFGKSEEGLGLTPDHALPLLRWVKVSRIDLLTGILATDPSSGPEIPDTPATELDATMWSNLARHAQVVKHFKFSAAGLTALLDKPEWFSLEKRMLDAQSPQALPALNLDLCYQIGQYHDWVSRCEQNGFEEKDALAFFGSLSNDGDGEGILASARQLGIWMGWPQGEILSLMSSLKKPKQNATQEQPIKAVVTFDDFLKQLTHDEKKMYDLWELRERGAMGEVLNMYMLQYRTSSEGNEADRQRGIYDKFKNFMRNNPAPLNVLASQYLPDTKPGIWSDMVRYERNLTRLTLKKFDPETSSPQAPNPEPNAENYMAGTLSDIDYALRMQKLCSLTALSLRSVLDLYSLDQNSPFDAYLSSSQLLLGACTGDDISEVQSRLQEQWRDALAGYLLGYWAGSDALWSTVIKSIDDLSSYFLTDVLVSSAARTSVAIQHTASLQHYLHKVLARLEPGYMRVGIPDRLSIPWKAYMSEYGSWKIWMTQMNHPENLIYYANRPNKTAAFQALEIELNQGKLDPELLQTAITGYLTKFEQTSNLQIVSGYLDGIDPKNDTYHFIGKTNASPAEYYWRSVDMALRDDKERLSPLAWTEWEKIAVAPTGQITQSSYTETAADSTVTKHTCDTIRPVMIEGRAYVFWVERGVVGLPSSDEKNQTPTKFKKLSVQYIFKQSDGFWSTPNELMSLDGTKNGKRLDDTVKDESSTSTDKKLVPNPYLKDDTYEPGLIALVNIEGPRAEDPWLTVMLYNCASHPKPDAGPGFCDIDHFVQSRDLLLIDIKALEKSNREKMSATIYNHYKDIKKIQHRYNGDALKMLPREIRYETFDYDLDNYDQLKFSSPHLIRKNELKLMATKMAELDRTAFDSESMRFDFANSLWTKVPFWYLPNSIYGSPPRIIEIMQNIAPINKSPPEFYPHPDNATWVAPSNSDTYAFSNIGNVASIEATLSTKTKKTVTLRCTYLRSISKKSNLSIKSITIQRGEGGDDNPNVRCFGNDIKMDNNEPCSLSLRIDSDQPDGPDHFTAGYSVNSEVYPPSTSSARAVAIKNRSHLLEESFRIRIYKDYQGASSEPLMSLPISEMEFNEESVVEITTRLYVKAPKETSFIKLSEQSVAADGKSYFIHDYTWTEDGQYILALCEAGDPGNNVFATYDLKDTQKDESWNISIKRNERQAQYLDLGTVALKNPIFPTNFIRLNTLFGKQLVSRAARSVERALEWDAQWIKEPTIDPAIENPPVDFHGANGIYFRELFLHLPNLVATRLSEQQQFDEAEHWFTEYLFDPFRTHMDDKNRPPFWNTRPLAEVGAGTSELQKVVNPTTRAFILSRFNRQAVFLSMVENWQRQGDHFYRQLTPSTLNHAWLSYQKALKLIGPLPERTAVSRWQPATLNQVNHSAFRTPINERVIEARKIIEQRLFNLRHGLTLDGKQLPVMDWRDEGADAFGFGQRGIGHLINSYNSDRLQVPAYRFRQLIPMARAAVRQIQDMGRYYMKLMEDEFNTTLDVLLKQHEIKISDFTLRLQQEAISSVKAKRDTLLLGREKAMQGKDYLGDLIDVGRSPREEAATGLIWMAAILKGSSIPFQVTAGITEGLVPNIFGLAFGGNKPAAPMARTALALQASGEASDFISQQLLMEAGYERRANEWQFELKQREMDIKLIDLQLKEIQIELNAATMSLDEARAHRRNLEEAYVAMTTGFTIIPIYNWLVARQELLYAPAYDAVLSLCLSAEAAWRYEIGDYKRSSFVKTSAWIDSYKGMLAGESLLVDLQEMENAYLQSNERRLIIKKTVDVWAATTDVGLKQLKALNNTPLTCDLKSADFDRNYPGHYLRQLKHVSVSFVMASDAGDSMKEVSAILTQTDSTTLVEPAEDGAEYLYAAGIKPPASVKRNLRAQQQIALSSMAADDGAGFAPEHWVYELTFHDGRYLPFEGTGAISRWQLSFPDAAFVKSLLSADGKTARVKRIELHLVYSAVDGGKDFTDKVKALIEKS